jgi:hypothetical protein
MFHHLRDSDRSSLHIEKAKSAANQVFLAQPDLRNA